MAKLANEPVFFILSDSIPEINSLVNSEKKIKLFRFDFNNPEHIEMFRLKTQENKRITAFGLAIFLGHFGVHRLYLGTKPIVPITYVLTMGGGFGFIPLIDAIMILATKDLGKFENNSKYFMWIDME
ncbi:MAG: TM2 domain-containing protein [Bacteroidetes bacterium]|nr:TM2 domain-containing protein [Bacteroidota bacterium]HET6242951.1 TM2 domain-containing protein [Bacteroidia bacterium]